MIGIEFHEDCSDLNKIAPENNSNTKHYLK